MPARKQTSRSVGAKKSSSKKKSRTNGAHSSAKKAAAKRTKRKKTPSHGAAAATQTALADVARSIGSTLGSITARAKKVVKQAAERFEQE